jgi:hypothetical protein
LVKGKIKIGASAVTAIGMASDIHHHSITKTVERTTRSFQVNEFGNPNEITTANTTGRIK